MGQGTRPMYCMKWHPCNPGWMGGRQAGCHFEGGERGDPWHLWIVDEAPSQRKGAYLATNLYSWAELWGPSDSNFVCGRMSGQWPVLIDISCEVPRFQTPRTSSSPLLRGGAAFKHQVHAHSSASHILHVNSYFRGLDVGKGGDDD